MPNTVQQDSPAPGTDPAPQNEARLAPGREGDDATAAEQRAQRGRRIDCSPGEERERRPSDGHGRHR